MAQRLVKLDNTQVSITEIQKEAVNSVFPVNQNSGQNTPWLHVKTEPQFHWYLTNSALLCISESRNLGKAIEDSARAKKNHSLSFKI